MWIKYKCADCGEFFLESEMYGGVCYECRPNPGIDKDEFEENLED